MAHKLTAAELTEQEQDLRELEPGPGEPPAKARAKAKRG